MDHCKLCNTEFKRKYPRGGQRKIYCSKRCRYQDSPKYIYKCKTCNKEFKVIHLHKNKEYCSVACKERYPCQLCGNIIKGRVKFQSGTKRFCSRKCSNFINRTLNSKKSYTAKGFAKTIKNFNRLLCEVCFIADIEVLCVHHIDSNHSNNNSENLKTLCANCHHREHWGKESKNRLKQIELANLIVKYL